MQPKRFVRSSIIAALLSSLWSVGALAGEGDVLTLNASAGYSYDTNVFRIASGSNPTGHDHRGDSIWSASAGLDANKVSGRQRIYGNVSATRSQYQDFTFLNNNGYQGIIGYRFGFGSDSEVGVYYSRNNQLVNYADRIGYYNRNMVESDRMGGDLLLRVAGDWMGVASATMGRDENSTYELRSGNSDIRAFDGGVRYQPRGSKNYVEARYRETETEYDHLEGGVDGNYKQREIRLASVWAPNQKSSFEAGVGSVSSEFENQTQRDFDSWTGYLGVAWRPTVVSTTNIRLFREVGAVGDAWGSYARTNGVSLKQIWQATAKLSFDADAAFRRRAYEGYQLPGVSVVYGEDNRRDRIFMVGAGANYAVTDKFMTRLSVRNERRISNLEQYSYTDTLYMLTGKYRF